MSENAFHKVGVPKGTRTYVDSKKSRNDRDRGLRLPLAGGGFNVGTYGSRGSAASRSWVWYWASAIRSGVSGFPTAGEGMRARNERRPGIPRPQSPPVDEDSHDQGMGDEAHYDHGMIRVSHHSATAHHEQPQVAALQPIEHVVRVRNAVREGELLRRVARQQKPCARRQPTKPGKSARVSGSIPQRDGHDHGRVRIPVEHRVEPSAVRCC